MMNGQPRQRRKGRGAVSNPTPRYDSTVPLEMDDGWGILDEELPPLRTTVVFDSTRSIIARNQSPDLPFDRSINPYRGCEHGCVYCFARPTHAYHGLSAGLDFESRLFFKPDGPALLRKELSRPSYVPRPIALGMNTDAYQPVERQLKLTRAFLEVLSEHNHPVTLLTKSALIQRDIDILAPMAEKGLARVGVSLTSLDPRLSRLMEPRAAAPYRRLQTISALADAGLPVIAMTAPIIPALNEPEMEDLLEASAEHGAVSAGYVLLRLPFELKDIFHEWLAAHYPDRAAKVINILRDMRGGQDYDANWFERGRGRGVHARLISQRFKKTARRLGLDEPRPRLRTDLFRPAEPPNGQMKLEF